MVARKKKTRFSAPELGRSVSRRPARVGDAIRKEMAMLLLRHLKDPRLFDVNITNVDVTPDLRIAKIYYDSPDDGVDDAAAGFLSAKGFIRSSLARELSLQYMPELIFVHDLAGAKHAEMDRLFMEIENERKKSSQ